MEKMVWDGLNWGQEDLFPANPDLANILAIFVHVFRFFRSMEKMAWGGPKWGQEDFFPTNPDLADILGRTDLDFENFYFLDFFCMFPVRAKIWPKWGQEDFFSLIQTLPTFRAERI